MRVQLINCTSFLKEKKTLSVGFFLKKTIHLVNSAQWSMAPLFTEQWSHAPLLKFLSHHEKLLLKTCGPISDFSGSYQQNTFYFP
jgi:hypothetical protein